MLVSSKLDEVLTVSNLLRPVVDEGVGRVGHRRGQAEIGRPGRQGRGVVGPVLVALRGALFHGRVAAIVVATHVAVAAVVIVADVVVVVVVVAAAVVLLFAVGVQLRARGGGRRVDVPGAACARGHDLTWKM